MNLLRLYPAEEYPKMRSTKTLLAIGLLAAAATTIPGGAEARRLGGVHAGGGRVAHFHGGVRPGWHGGGTQWHRGGGHYAGGRYYRGGYYRPGWGWPAAGVAAGAALGAGAAAAYGSSCYQQQWNGYSYVTVNVC